MQGYTLPAMTFGEFVRTHRKKKKFSLWRLGRLSKLQITLIRKIEDGNNCTVVTLGRLCRALDINSIPVESLDLNFLGYLSRFVNFVDAIYNCGLPLLIRGTQLALLDTSGSDMHRALVACDQRVAGGYGQAAWVEWTRCLSRLRSREAINAQLAALAAP